MPSAYALFAAALVLATGVVLRRAAAAIGITLVAFVALRLGIEGWVRANYLSPGAPGVDRLGRSRTCTVPG